MTKVALFDAHGGSISSHVWLYRKILPTEVDISGRRLKKALDYANREGLKQVLILGENELASGKISLKLCRMAGKRM